MVSLQAFLSFLLRAPKFPLPLHLLTPATQANQFNITQSTGMATQMQLKVLFGRIREKIRNNVVSFFDVIFDVYTHVDNRESARASD